MIEQLNAAIHSVASATRLNIGRVQIQYDLRDADPDGGPPLPWTVEVSLDPLRKNGVRRSVCGYGATLEEAMREAIAAVERHR